jgi:hypothetical protein
MQGLCSMDFAQKKSEDYRHIDYPDAIKKSLLDICYYNFRSLEMYHYNSSIWKYVIAIKGVSSTEY